MTKTCFYFYSKLYKFVLALALMHKEQFLPNVTCLIRVYFTEHAQITIF